MKYKTIEAGKFATMIVDCDFDLSIKHHASEADARAYLEDQYEDIASVGEPGGEEYGPNEQPNTMIYIVQIVATAAV